MSYFYIKGKNLKIRWLECKLKAGMFRQMNRKLLDVNIQFFFQIKYKNGK